MEHELQTDIECSIERQANLHGGQVPLALLPAHAHEEVPSLEALEAQLRPSFVDKPGEPPRKQAQQAQREGERAGGLLERGVNFLERAVARDLDGDGDVGQVLCARMEHAPPPSTRHRRRSNGLVFHCTASSRTPRTARLTHRTARLTPRTARLTHRTARLTHRTVGPLFPTSHHAFLPLLLPHHPPTSSCLPFPPGGSPTISIERRTAGAAAALKPIERAQREIERVHRRGAGDELAGGATGRRAPPADSAHGLHRRRRQQVRTRAAISTQMWLSVPKCGSQRVRRCAKARPKR